MGQTAAFDCDRLGFEAEYQDPPEEPFFAMIRRDGAILFFKSEKDVLPMPNSSRHSWIKWDGYVFVQDPDALAEEFAASGVTVHAPLGITSENLRGFDVRDPDGSVAIFRAAELILAG